MVRKREERREIVLKLKPMTLNLETASCKQNGQIIKSGDLRIWAGRILQILAFFLFLMFESLPLPHSTGIESYVDHKVAPQILEQCG